jgi:hypothetical protein
MPNDWAAERAEREALRVCHAGLDARARSRSKRCGTAGTPAHPRDDIAREIGVLNDRWCMLAKHVHPKVSDRGSVRE